MFKTELKITNPSNPLWKNQFNTELRGLVLRDLSVDVSKNYVTVLKTVAKTTLLYRVKWFLDDEYNLINLWATEADYDLFYSTVGGDLFFAEYVALGYNVSFTKNLITDTEADTIITDTLSHPGRVIQVLSPSFGVSATVNDPL